MEVAIKASNLGVTKDGFEILKNVSVELSAGKIIGLLGPSGAGKTTFIRSVIGRQKLSHGSLDVLGLPAGSAALRSQIGYMPQTPAAYSDLTVQQNLAYFAKMNGQASHVHQLLAKVGLAKQANQLVGSLSGGQKSRVSLAIALLGSPKLLVLDEPTVGVDPVLRKQLWELFHDLAQTGVTLLVSSHVMDEASRCDELVLIRDGQILAQGSPKELENRTKTSNIEDSFLKLVESKS
ncbi:MAG TPA: ABC transporter ATP-binding protein [Candidatus Saccharimonadales bacterium]|nr:ABC transporter ATP-binding protein [Candidatus Saccharimonadales bacterium]